MVLTDKQRSDLHAGIYEYLLSRGAAFAAAAQAVHDADPESCRSVDESSSSSHDKDGNNNNSNDNDDVDKSSGLTSPRRGARSSSDTPVLEKKWTAVPRLQRRVIELEKQISNNAKIHAHRAGFTGSSGASSDSTGIAASGGIMGRERRMLPRPPAQHTLQSHSAVVTTLSLHPIYTLAASGSEDGTIKLWDHESGDYMRTLRGHTNVVTSVDFSPSGSYLASTSTDLSIKIWDMKEFTCVRTLRGHDHTISCVRFVPPGWDAVFLDGSKSGGGGGSGGRSGGESGGRRSGAIDPAEAGSKFIVTASRDTTVKFWDLETGFCDHTVSDHGDWVRCIAVRAACAPASSGGGSSASAAGGGAGSADSGSGENSTSTANLALVATSGNDRTIYVYDANDKRAKVAELRGHDHVVESLSFLCSSSLPRKGGSGSGGPPSSSSKSGSDGASSNNTWDYLASGGRDRTVRLWTVANGGSCLAVFRAHENWVRGVLVHPSGNHLLSCGDDRTIRVFDIKSSRCLRTIEEAHPHFVTSIAMHPTLPIMISGGVDHTVKCWQLD